jgi:hypothetical protein
MAHASFLEFIMLKVELTKYPISLEVVNDLVVYLIYNQIKSVPEFISINDEDLQKKPGFKPVFLEVAHLIRGIEFN